MKIKNKKKTYFKPIITERKINILLINQKTKSFFGGEELFLAVCCSRTCCGTGFCC